MANRVEEVFIRCELAGTGMFPTEKNIVIRTAEGGTVSFFADQSLLCGGDPPSKVRATRLATDADVSVCLLPSEDSGTGSRWVRIRNDDVLVA